MFYKRAALSEKTEQSIIRMINNHSKICENKVYAFKEILNVIEEVSREKSFKPYEINRICSKLESSIAVACDDSELMCCMDYIHAFKTDFNMSDGDNKMGPFQPFKDYLLEAMDKRKSLNAIERNYSKLNKKVNLESAIKYLGVSKAALEDSVYETCRSIEEAYGNVEKSNLLAISLDTVSYAHSKHLSTLSEQEVLNGVLTYFSLNENYTSDIIERGINISRSSIIEEEVKPASKFDRRKIKSHIDDIYKSIRKNDDIKEINKEVNFLVKKMYKVSKNDMIDDTPSILTFVRRVFLYGGALSINPVLIIPVALVDSYISYKVNSTEVNSLLKKLKKQRETLSQKVDHSNEKKKKSQQEYLKKLDSQIDRLETYKDNLKGELEQRDDMENMSFDELAALVIGTDNTFNSVVNEGNVQNILITAKEKLRKSTEGLSGKEKRISKTIDQNVDKVLDSVKNTLTLREKDKIIEGRILPSASTVIKLALTAGAAWAINPAVAVIGALASIAMSKEINAKQRQLIYDELDSHIRLVKRKIEEAERKDDSAALEELYQIERKLKREKQRIQYRAKVYHNQIL